MKTISKCFMSQETVFFFPYILAVSHSLLQQTEFHGHQHTQGTLSLNRDIGQELLPVMLQLVSHDVSHVT